MSDANAPAQTQAVDPVAAARAKLAAEDEGSTDAVSGLKKQVRALWVISIVTLVLVIVLAAFSVLPRAFGIGGMRGGRPPSGAPGQWQQGGQQGMPSQQDPASQ